MSLSPPTLLPHCFFSGHISRFDRLEQATGKLERKLYRRLITRVCLNCSYQYQLSGNYGGEKPYKYKVSASRFFFQNALYLLVLEETKRLRIHHLDLYIVSHKPPVTLGRYIDVEKVISSIQWSDIGVLPWENFNLGSPAFQCIFLSNQGKFLGIRMRSLFSHICFIYILFAFTQSSLVKKKIRQIYYPLKKITFCKQPGLP